MNMAGNFGGFASTNTFPLLRALTGSAAAYLYAAAALNVAAIVCWQLMPGAGRAAVSTPSAGPVGRRRILNEESCERQFHTGSAGGARSSVDRAAAVSLRPDRNRPRVGPRPQSGGA